VNMKKINMTVLTPDRPLLSNVEVDSIVIPAFEGEMGILPDHAPIVVQLKEGILKYTVSGVNEFLSVFWGFAYVKNNEVVILTEMSELMKEINEERARQEFQKAKDAITMKGADMDMDTAQASLKKALVRMKLVEIRNKSKV